MTQMNSCIKQKQNHRQRTDLWLPRLGSQRDGWVGNLRLANASYYIYI